MKKVREGDEWTEEMNAAADIMLDSVVTCVLQTELRTDEEGYLLVWFLLQIIIS